VPFLAVLSDGVTGNTPDFDSGKSRFEPWSDNESKIPVIEAGILFVCKPELFGVTGPVRKPNERIMDNIPWR
jgi:hypothetical protein